MISETDLEARRQEVAGMILESEIVTSSVEDDEAEVLPDWALAQSKVTLSPARTWEKRKQMSMSPRMWVRFAV